MEPRSFLSSLRSTGTVEQEKGRAEPSSPQTIVKFYTSAPDLCPRPLPIVQTPSLPRKPPHFTFQQSLDKE